MLLPDDPVRPCAHFGACGGCASQTTAYADQVLAKSEVLGQLFGAYWPTPIPVAPAPVTWHYRNRVDFNFARRRYDEMPPPDFVRETVLGFNQKGRWYSILDIEECLIGPPGMDRLLESVRAWYRCEGLHAWDSNTGEGMLRGLLVREGKRTGERMVVIVTRSGDFPAESFVDCVLGASNVTSVQRAIHNGIAQGVFAESIEVLHGAPHIHEELRVPGTPNPLRFRISPLSFFQTNTLATEVLYSEIRRWVQDVAPTVLYDLYGGAGGIAMTVADLVAVARSVENVQSASLDGEHNIVANAIGNVYFTTADIKDYASSISGQGGMEPRSAVVLDPPRAGMHPKAIKGLVACRPPDLLYVSCNPAVFARELPEFLRAYTLTDMHAVDLFPHTPHVELLAAMRLRS